jgi:uncharacterized repeat protein (TIGR03803 family)
MTTTGKASRTHLRAASIALALAMVLVAAVVAQGQTPSKATFKVLHSFTGGNDGGYPFAGLIQDTKGNLYGTTWSGGAYDSGVVFAVPKTGGETLLYTFTGGNDGASPYAGLILSAGNLYGTAAYGGASDNGVVYEVPGSGGSESVLYTFTGGDDGANPYAGLLRDAKGDLYGTTTQGGHGYSGVVFELAPNGKETVLYSFTGGTDGSQPYSGLVAGKGYVDLFSVTVEGGANGLGTVFKVVPKSKKETVLHSFSSGSDGYYPYDYGSLLQDLQGDLYGTTCCGGAYGYGTVFRIAANGTETVLYNFTGHPDGAWPDAGLIRDAKGDLYGTTYGGGTTGCYDHDGCGTVFMLSKTGKETVLYTFTGGDDGANPYGDLLRDARGDLYGTALDGGTSGYGTVFKLTP